MGYTKHRKGVAGRRLVPHVVIEVTAAIRVRGGYFFLLLTEITRLIMPMITSEYWNNPLYVTTGQPPFRKIRGQEAPPAGGPNRLPLLATLKDNSLLLQNTIDCDKLQPLI